MKCSEIREALSAQLDGEDPGAPAEHVELHLRACLACAGWLATAETASRRAVLATAVEVPDRVPEILAAATAQGLLGGESQQRSHRWRWTLAGLGLLQVMVAVQSVLAAGPSGPGHLGHELASWDVALAVGFLFAAWRPARAWGMLPLVAALVGCILFTAALDVTGGQTSFSDEVTHALEIAGLWALWMLARLPSGQRQPQLHLA